MRWVIAITAVLALRALGTGTDMGWHVRATIDPTVTAALEARCGELDEQGRGECEDDLIDGFAVGEFAPDDVLRLHCTRWLGTWSVVREAPLPICEERYGGWITS